ncbi:cobalamin-binding protein [Halobacillus locisalis]|uniref:Cobalamin-binding protein n=1 Tax=Halobacillus locisalis TaxID=220753 RepID=A0A838CRN3_9BACI|nr:cobalamin-binding protein [Halobacillus locisalis]MBA2174604.1 cobalamin-binding protein [Halobacillus locisalis]
MRIVSICPSNTEIIAYLGKTELLVGVDNYSDYPEQVLSLPKLGPDLSIDLDKVEELKPDLVLASLSVPGMDQNIKGLIKRELPYIILNPNSLEEIAEDIRTVGAAIGEPELGKERAAEFSAEIEKYKTSAMNEEYKPALYWEWWPKPIFTPGRTNWLSEISELAGAYNVFYDLEQANVQTDWDEVRKRRPDHICMVWVGVKEEKMNPDHVRKRPGWADLEAVREGRIHILEESLYCRPSPRLLEGLKKLYALLH